MRWRRVLALQGALLVPPMSSGLTVRAPSSTLRKLAPSLYAELNAAAFDGTLPDKLPLTWNSRLSRTAGRCIFFSDAEHRRTAEIELSAHVLDAPGRLRETLAHEMCHAAQWIVDGAASPPHGHAFQAWARQLEQRVPDICVTTRHSYVVTSRHIYVCTQCAHGYHRHRRIDVHRRRCGRCGGSLRDETPMRRDDGPAATSTGAPRRHLPPFAAFVKAEYAAQRRRWPRVPHKRIMQALGRRWRAQSRSRSSKRATSTRAPPAAAKRTRTHILGRRGARAARPER